MPKDLETHVSDIRAEGFDEYEVRPTYPREFYTSIVFLEPFDWRNQRAFGYDMYSNPVRREAMDRAISSGAPAMSGMVTLVQETEEDKQQGWLYYIPMFENESLDGVTTQRSSDDFRSRLTGFVYGAFRAKDLMAGILRDQNDEVKFEIFDSVVPHKESLLFDSDHQCHLDTSGDSRFSMTHCINVRGRDWALHFEFCKGLIEAAGANQSWLLGLGGLAVDFLLFVVIAIIGTQKRRAVRLANEMTADLRVREELIGEILANVSDAIVTVDQDGFVEMANRGAKTMFGFSRKNLAYQFPEPLISQNSFNAYQ